MTCICGNSSHCSCPQSTTPTSSPATTPSKTTLNGVANDHSSTSSPTAMSSHGRLSKRFQALSFSKLKHVKSEGGAVGGASGNGSVSSLRSPADSSSPHHSVDLEREDFPGGDAMLEVLTRLQSYQESMQMQLEVRFHHVVREYSFT